MIGALKKSLLSAKQDPIKNRRFKTVTINQPVFSLPDDAINGGLNITAKGRSLKNELNYNRDTWAEWTKSVGNTADSTGLNLDIAQICIAYNTLASPKISTKYGILFNIVNNSMSGGGLYAKLCDVIIGASFVSANGETGNKKFTVTTGATLPNSRFVVDRNFTTYTGMVKFRDFRVFELPTGSEIETDFTNLTADELAQKYPYIKGDGVKSTLSTRVKSVGKNLFDPSKSPNEVQLTNSSQITNGIRVTANSQGTYRLVGYSIQLLPNTVYKFKCNSTRTGTTGGGVSIRDDISTGTILAGNADALNPDLSFTTPSHGKIRIYFYATFSTSELASADYTNIQLGLGNVYEPYTYTEAYLPEVGRSVPSAKDEIDVYSDGQWYKTIRISDTKVINGGSGFVSGNLLTSTNTYRNIVTIGYSDALQSTANSAKATSLDGDYPIASTTGDDSRNISFVGSNLYIRIEKSKVDVMAGATTFYKFVAYLNAYPVTLHYQLKDAQYKYYIPEIQLGCPDGLKSFKGGTFIVEPVGDPAESTQPTIEITYEVSA